MPNSPSLLAGQAAVLAELENLLPPTKTPLGAVAMTLIDESQSKTGDSSIGRRVAAHVADNQVRRLRIRSSGLTLLPNSLANLAALEELDLTGNRLSSFPPVLLQLKQLRWLSLGDNQAFVDPP